MYTYLINMKIYIYVYIFNINICASSAAHELLAQEECSDDRTVVFIYSLP